VVFDDASQDATFELALGIKAARDVPKLHVLKHEKNLGYGGNQKAGYRYFIEKGFDIVVLLHGDGQYAPEILASMYHPLVTGEADAVFGSRMMRTYGGPLKGGMPLYKFVGNRVLTILENRALGTNLTEFHSGYRAYNLHALARLDFSRMTDDFHFDTEIIIKLHHQGMTIREVPIPTYYGTELCNVDGMKYARDVLRSVWRYRRTRSSVTRAPAITAPEESLTVPRISVDVVCETAAKTKARSPIETSAIFRSFMAMLLAVRLIARWRDDITVYRRRQWQPSYDPGTLRVPTTRPRRPARTLRHRAALGRWRDGRSLSSER